MVHAVHTAPLLALFALGVAGGATYSKDCSVPNTGPVLTSCASQPAVYSCENTAPIKDTCCSPTPGGLVLATQFWSTYTGLENKKQKLPKGAWTIHGLWPDNCDGSYEQYCDLSRQFDPKPSPAKFPDGTVIPAYKGPGRRRHQRVSYVGQFSKHATCTSTFDVKCYGPSYKKNQDVINYFDAAIRAYHLFPTFDVLAASGIVPSNKTTYSLAQFERALAAQFGTTPYLGCTNNGTVLSEVWYFNHVLGTEQYGSYKPLNSTSPSSCTKTGKIWYYERSKNSEQEVRK
ncbi:hypothetical protein DXG03_008090 [Asterophora parasitica]|uniref:Uncharacterized protein n=1 Tax=Asterophora parasitica TaxID=117018 RepID=A0A9P7G5V0_9AGAR|nr:hypothetical protein DXG03_008090 [Asterophora parasitica]